MNPRKTPRNGFTLVELLVSMGVCGALMAVLTPAVQQSRGRMRDAQCKNHLKQIGLALHNHEQSHGVFPTTGNYQLRLASHLEDSRSIWRCPADSRESLATPGQCSYLMNDGTVFRFHQRNGFAVQPMKELGSARRDTRARDISDGLSQTAAYSERLVMGDYFEGSLESELRSDPKRFLWYLPARQPDVDTLVDACERGRLTPYPLRYKTGGTFADVGYDHILTPNRTGCQNGSPATVGLIGDQVSSAVTATSEHGGYVNVLMADGAVKAFNDEIDLQVWRALGTRNGGETTSLE
jgi:prepilin-type N-terminal cleavage/methylation domain-containing protein/prepilin-type processing-associated H-X9-DG protein